MAKACGPSIGIFGHYGNRNLGDEAIITAVIQNLRHELPSARLIGFSINPDDTTRRHGIPAFPIRVNSNGKKAGKEKPEVSATRSTERSALGDEDVSRSRRIKSRLKGIPILGTILRSANRVPRLTGNLAAELGFLTRAYHNLKNIDLLLIAGSNQFLDNFGGPLGFPYTLCKWSLLTRLTGTQLAYVSVGAGPLDAWLSKALVKIALRFSQYTSFRDEGSSRLMRSIGYHGSSLVRPDLAHSLSFQRACRRPLSERTRPTVCINAMPLYDKRYWCIPDEKRYHEYVDKLAGFSARLLQDGYPLIFFACQIRDLNVIEDILTILNAKGDSSPEADITIRVSDSVLGLMNDIQTGSIVVATRFHGVLLSLLAERPVAGICYAAKTREQMIDMGQGAYALDFDSFSTQDLVERFKALEHNMSVEVGKVSAKKQEYQQALHRQYQDIVTLLSVYTTRGSARSTMWAWFKRRGSQGRSKP